MYDDKYALMKMPVKEIGRALACSGDNEQAAVVNELGKELAMICRDPELTGMQVCYIAKSLDKWGKLLIKQLSEYVALSEHEGMDE
jgi:hypothetical protein